LLLGKEILDARIVPTDFSGGEILPFFGDRCSCWDIPEGKKIKNDQIGQ
jgi:hypothetical protein